MRFSHLDLARVVLQFSGEPVQCSCGKVCVSFSLICFMMIVKLDLMDRWLLVLGSLVIAQRAKSRGFCGESPGIVVVGGGNPRGNLGCK